MPFIEEFSRNWTCSLKAVETGTPCSTDLCYNGECKSTFTNLSFWQTSFRLDHCECDYGWIGRQCDVCCDLPCQNDGICEIYADTGLPFCDCFPQIKWVTSMMLMQSSNVRTSFACLCGSFCCRQLLQALLVSFDLKWLHCKLHVQCSTYVINSCDTVISLIDRWQNSSIANCHTQDGHIRRSVNHHDHFCNLILQHNWAAL